MDRSIKAADWIAHHASLVPSRPACIDLASGRTRSYADLHARVARLSGFLRTTLRLETGARVLVLSKNDIDVFEIQFACQRAGLVFVPVNWRLTEPEIDFIARDSAAAVLFHGDTFRSAADGLRASGALDHLVEMRCGRPSAYEAAIADSQPLAEAVDRYDTDCWALIYTSGTTGYPKGAMISYRMALYNAIALCAAFDIDGSSRSLVTLPTFHTGGLNVFANPVFYRGGTNVVMRDFVPGEAIAAIAAQDSRITHLMAVPTMHAMLAAEPGFERLAASRLHAIAVAGASCPLATIDAYDRIGLRLRQCWGMTEAGPLGILMPPHNPADKHGSSGLPGMFIEAMVVMPDGSRAPDGEIGELVVRGPVVTHGYWRRKEVDDRLFDAAGWFRTGDAAYRDRDGYYYIVDRWKDMYISGGENVYPAEIERVLHLLDGVADCAVVGRPDGKWGEVGRAFIVRKEGSTSDEAALAAHCGRHLARYKIPKDFVFVDALPRNASGKILKHRLREAGSASARPVQGGIP